MAKEPGNKEMFKAMVNNLNTIAENQADQTQQLINIEEASIAARNGIFLELSGRKGHGLANGHVARMAKQSGAEIILDSDAHEPEDLMTRDYAEKVALGAGLEPAEMRHTLNESPQALLNQISKHSE